MLNLQRIKNPILIQLHNKIFEPFLSDREISSRIEQMAQNIAADLKDETPVFVGVLNGAFVFLSDLARKYPANCEVEFVKLTSYKGTASTGNVQQLIGLDKDLSQKTIVIVEDIVDTGKTMGVLYEIFGQKKPKKLMTATLFLKPEVYQNQIPLDYVAFEIPNKFIVGYGLDYDGLGRNLPEVYQLKS